MHSIDASKYLLTIHFSIYNVFVSMVIGGVMKYSNSIFIGIGKIPNMFLKFRDKHNTEPPYEYLLRFR